MKHPLIVEGHTYRAAGAAYGEDGERVNDTSAGAGRAVCECGERSPVLPSRNPRLNWHRQHREEIAGVSWDV